MVLAPTVAATVLGFAFAAQSRRVQKKVERWWALVSDYLEIGSVEAAAAEIQRNIEAPWAHEAVIEATRRILEDIDEAALPYLARLTAEAIKGRRVPYDRDRSAAALLVIRRAGVLAALRAFVLDCVRNWPVGADAVAVKIFTDGPDVPRVVSTHHPHSPELSVSIRTPVFTQGDSGLNKEQGPASTEVRFPTTAAVYEVLTSMKQYGFAVEMPGGFWGVQTGPHVASLEKSGVEFLGKLLR